MCGSEWAEVKSKVGVPCPYHTEPGTGADRLQLRLRLRFRRRLSASVRLQPYHIWVGRGLNGYSKGSQVTGCTPSTRLSAASEARRWTTVMTRAASADSGTDHAKLEGDI